MTVEALIASISPDFVCISVTKSPISSICSGDGVDDEVGTFGDHDEVVVGDQRGDLNDDVTLRFEARHLQIHPYQHASTLPNRQRGVDFAAIASPYGNPGQDAASRRDASHLRQRG